MLSLKTILHPTDFSEHSDLAFRLACALARESGARLAVVHVNAPPPAMFAGEGVIPPIAEATPESAWEQLRQVAPADRGIRVEHLLYEGDEAAEIVRAARDTHADLIVMGTHGRTGLSRLLLGSVAEQVLRRAPCPVLTVRPGSDSLLLGEAAPDGAATAAV